jgi:hypothetical protein
MCINYFRNVQGKPKIITDSKTGIPLYMAKLKKKNLKAVSPSRKHISFSLHVNIVKLVVFYTEGET